MRLEIRDAPAKDLIIPIMKLQLSANGIGRDWPHQVALSVDIRHAILGNAGPIVSFRVGAEDASYIGQEFQGRFDEVDLMWLGTITSI
jgi:hypothetical protein